MGQLNLWTYVSITDIVEELLIEIFHTTWHPILFLCSSNYPFYFLLLICINSLQSVFLPDCLYTFQKPFNYLLILLFTYYITTFDLCNPSLCLDLAKMNFSCKVCNHFLNCFPLLIYSAHLCIGEQPNKISLEMLYNVRLSNSKKREISETCWFISVQVREIKPRESFASSQWWDDCHFQAVCMHSIYNIQSKTRQTSCQV